MTWYDKITNHKRIPVKVLTARPAEEYSEQEIADLFAMCRNDFERDYLTDRLYVSNRKVGPRSREGYYFFTARQMYRDQNNNPCVSLSAILEP